MSELADKKFKIMMINTSKLISKDTTRYDIINRRNVGNI